MARLSLVVEVIRSIVNDVGAFPAGESRGPFHGWLRVVRPKDPVILKARLVLQCEGFAPVSRDFEWNLAPDTCKPGVELGELPSTPLADGTQ